MFEEVSGGLDYIDLGKAGRCPAARTWRRFASRGSDQQKRVKDLLAAASATGCTWPRCSRSGGNLLLLDEPTNDLDVETLRALEEALLDFAGCAVVISHDRWFLDRIATHILAFEGESKAFFFEGNFQDYEADKKKPPGRRGAAAAPHPLPAAHAQLKPARRRLPRAPASARRRAPPCARAGLGEGSGPPVPLRCGRGGLVASRGPLPLRRPCSP